MEQTSVLLGDLPEDFTYSSIISLTVVDTLSLELSFQISSGFSWVPSKICTAASGLSLMASIKTLGRNFINVMRTYMRVFEKEKRPIGQLSVWCALHFSRVDYCCYLWYGWSGPQLSTKPPGVGEEINLGLCKDNFNKTHMAHSYISIQFRFFCFKFKTLEEIQYCWCIYHPEHTLLDHALHTWFLLPRIPLVGLSLQLSIMPPALANKYFSCCLCAFQVIYFAILSFILHCVSFQKGLKMQL